jgi:molybdopterin-biosynthesis enzyme MoeA-like protein
MSKHHLVVFANYCRDTGMTLVEAVQYVGDNYDELANEITNAYEETYDELMQFANMQNE